MSRIYTLKNERLALEASSLGGEMRSLRFDGKELLWQGDPRYWEGRAPNLFPYIARLTGGAYTYMAKTYHMDIHGFVKDSEMDASGSSKVLSFTLASSPETLTQYPFPFRYTVSYHLTGTSLYVGYTVENTGGDTMYFGIGGHPGFSLPLEEGSQFEDYVLEFSEACEPNRILFSPENFVCGSAPFHLRENRILPLAHPLFDDDAIVLENPADSVTLKSCKGRLALTVESPGFRYLGLWHTPRSQAPFLCIEPWSSLPSRQGIVEELSEQENLISLKQGEVYENEWRIVLRG